MVPNNTPPVKDLVYKVYKITTFLVSTFASAAHQEEMSRHKLVSTAHYKKNQDLASIDC